MACTVFLANTSNIVGVIHVKVTHLSVLSDNKNTPRILDLFLEWVLAGVDLLPGKLNGSRLWMNARISESRYGAFDLVERARCGPPPKIAGSNEMNSFFIIIFLLSLV
jgi:hypothetical protein